LKWATASDLIGVATPQSEQGMAVSRAKSIEIRDVLTSLLPKAELEQLAYGSGMVQRRRKVDPSAMLWTLVLGFATGRERTLAGPARDKSIAR